MPILPKFHDANQSLMLLQTKWKSILDPVLKNAILSGLQLNNISLSAGQNVINHNLSRTQTGWFLTDINAASTIYRSANFNSVSLTLTASQPCTVDIWVY